MFDWTFTPRFRASSMSEDLLHPAPVLLVGDLEMDDVDGNAGPLADRDRLLDRVEHARAFVADVAGEDAARPLHLAAELDQVVGGREEPGARREHRRQPERAVLHRLGDEGPHLAQLRGRGPPVRFAHHAAPDVPLADVGGDVHRHLRLLERFEICA
jgi:hypothetical protein